MPIYEYECLNCKGNFSLLQKMGASERDTRCPECGSRDVKKKVSAFMCSATGYPGPASSGGGSGGA